MLGFYYTINRAFWQGELGGLSNHETALIGWVLQITHLQAPEHHYSHHKVEK
jgi:hypothetical protein